MKMSLQGERRGEEKNMPSRLFVQFFSNHPGLQKILMLIEI
jgi:hypothetical protein